MGREVQGTLTFFPVSSQKFVVLSLFTFGIYPIYWFYGNWNRICAVTGETISPFWRTFFAPVWGISLLDRIRQRAVSGQITVTWNPVSLGIAFFVLSLMAFLPGSWSLLSIGWFAPLVPAVQTSKQINAAAGNPEGINDSYGWGNVATIIIGALVWALLVFAMTLPK